MLDDPSASSQSAARAPPKAARQAPTLTAILQIGDRILAAAAAATGDPPPSRPISRSSASPSSAASRPTTSPARSAGTILVEDTALVVYRAPFFRVLTRLLARQGRCRDVSVAMH